MPSFSKFYKINFSSSVIFLFFLSIIFSGIGISAKDSQLTLINVSILISAFLLICLASSQYPLPIFPPPLSLILTAILVYSFITSTYSSDLMKSFLWVLLLFRNFLIFYIFYIIAKQDKYKQFFLNLYALLVISSIIAMPAYFIAYNNPDLVKSNPYPGLIYRGGEAFFPHFQAFTFNPIYLSFISLVLVSYIIEGDLKRKKFLMTVPLIFIIMLTFSRGALLILLSIICIRILQGISYSLKHQSLNIKRLIITSFYITTLTASLGSPFFAPIIDRIEYRANNANIASRYNNSWQFIIDESLNNPLFGNGLRQADISLDGIPIENSFLEIFHDQGVTGIILIMSLIIYAFTYRTKGLQFKYPLILFTIVLSMGYIGIHFDPFMWSLLGLIAGKERGDGQ